MLEATLSGFGLNPSSFKDWSPLLTGVPVLDTKSMVALGRDDVCVPGILIPYGSDVLVVLDIYRNRNSMW